MLYKIILILLVFIPFQVFSADLDTTVTEAFELYSVSNFTEAAPMFEEAYYMAKKNSAKDISSRFRTSLYAGLSYRGIGEYAQAKAWFLVSLALAEKVQDLYDIPTLIAYVAESARLAGDIHEAETYYTKALMYDDLTDKDKAVLYYGLAETNRLSEQYHLSKENCDKALDYATGLKLQKILSSCDIIYGEFYRTHKDYAKAMFYFSRAADTSRARKYADILVPALNGMGLTSEALHRPDAAREYFEQSFFVALENGAVDNTDIIYKKIMDYMPEKGSFKYQGDKFMVNPTEYLYLIRDKAQLFIYDGLDFKRIPVLDLLKDQTKVSITFSSKNLESDDKIEKLADALHYFNNIQFNFDSFNISSRAESIRYIYKRNTGTQSATSDDDL